MTNSITVKRKFQVRKERHDKKVVASGNAAALPSARVPRISRLMALAIHFDQLIRGGVVSDQSELARLGPVSRARLTQIMNLLNLAPDVQESILYMERANSGIRHITERQLRRVVECADWNAQRQVFTRIV